jgi:Lactonase, 7-bladed beta-propeller
MKIGLRARRLLVAPLRTGIVTVGVFGIGLLGTGFLTGCKNFWAAPTGSTSFALSSGSNITVSAGATSGNTSLITVTPSNSFTGTVTLTCAVTTSISNAVSPVTCGLSPNSVSISGTTAETSTLTATTTSTTTSGAYQITVTGASSGATSETTAVCVEVGTSTGGCSSSASTSGIFYILNPTSISGYSISSGTLNTISGTTYTLTGATAMAMSPSGNFLYVASLNGITLYTIDTSTGALGQGSVAVFDDPLAQAIQVDPSGKWLLDASGAGTLNAYPITSDGALDTTRTVPTPVNMSGGAGVVKPGGIAISSTLVAVALGSTGMQVFPFSADSASPLGSGGTYAPHGGSSGAAIAVAIDPQSRLLYVGETAAFPNTPANSGALRVFTIGSSAALTEFTYTTGAPYAPAGIGVHAILPDSTGNYVYAASWQTGAVGTITGYSVTTSALTALSNTPATGTEPYGLAEDSTDSFVLAVSNSGPNLDVYSLASTSGQLGTPLTGSPVSTPIMIVAAPAVP